MHRSLVVVSLAAVSAVFLGAARREAAPPRLSAGAAEVTRLQRHFDSVDVELRSRNVSSLSASQKASRARLIGWLREYRNAGVFPTNDRYKVAMPFFRDSQGVLCAMAYLIDRSGSGDIVDKVARTRNNAFLAELADDPALIAWLAKNGLSVDEAARIQPSYDGGICCSVDASDRVRSNFALAALGLSAASLATSAVNVVEPSYASGLLGVVAGAASIIVASSRLDDNRGTQRVATATVAVGALSLGAGVYGLLAARSRDRDDDRWRDGRRRRRDLVATPDLQIGDGVPRAGLLFNAKF